MITSQREIIPHFTDEWNTIDIFHTAQSTYVGKFQKKRKFAKLDWEKNIIAIKRVVKTNENEKEVDIINSHEHDNIVKCFACGQDNRYYYIYMEWIDHSLRDILIKSKKRSINIGVILWITYEMLLVMKYIHDNNLIHRDIKPANIMVDYNNHKVKLVDFGLSKKFTNDEASKYYSNCGTTGYRAPEVIKSNNQACRKSDIWSLACVIIAMGGGILPNDEYGGNDKHINSMPDHYPDNLKSLIKECLHLDVDKRCDVKWLLNHDIFKPLSSENIIYYKPKLNVYLLNGNELFPIYTNDQKRDLLNGIFSSATQLIFGYRFNQPLKLNDIPSSVTQLTLGGSFNQSLKPNDIPSSVTQLTFGVLFNQPLESNAIPSSVTQLTFGYRFNQPLKPNDIPDSVTQLKFGHHFDQPLKSNDIPSSVTQLTFGVCFNQPLKPNDIPDSVTQLTFGYRFNQSLKLNDIPSSVTQLTLGGGFNQPLKPNDIHITILSINSNYRLKGELTSNVPNLLHLIITEYNGGKLDDNIFNVQKLELISKENCKFDNSLLNEFPIKSKLIIDGNKYLYDEKLKTYLKLNKH